jgi:hypothetical protein
MRETVEIYVPSGYASAKEFLKDCGFEQVDRNLPWDHPATRDYEPVEKRAREIYDRFAYDGPPGTTKPSWAPRGNGLKQDEARSIARQELRAADHCPS